MNQSSRPWRIALVIAFLSSAAALSATVSAPEAAAATTVHGTVTCLSEAAVKGVYVNANSGGSGWATWSGFDGNKANWSRSLPNGGAYYLAVGCGGSPANWQRTLYSDTIGSTRQLLCQDVPGQDRYGRCF